MLNSEGMITYDMAFTMNKSRGSCAQMPNLPGHEMGARTNRTGCSTLVAWCVVRLAQHTFSSWGSRLPSAAAWPTRQMCAQAGLSTHAHYQDLIRQAPKLLRRGGLQSLRLAGEGHLKSARTCAPRASSREYQ